MKQALLLVGVLSFFVSCATQQELIEANAGPTIGVPLSAALQKHLEKETPKTEVYLSAYGEIYRLKAQGRLRGFLGKDKIALSAPIGRIDLTKPDLALEKDFEYPLTLNIKVTNLRTGYCAVVVLRRVTRDGDWKRVGL